MSSSTATDLVLVQQILKRISGNLGTLIDREIWFGSVQAESATTRAVGTGQIHISFKLAFDHEAGERHHGSILVPLPDAIAMAAYLMMLPDPAVEEARGQTQLDREMKDAILELGNFVGGAVNEVLQSRGAKELTARSEGCQGVRPDVPPNFVYTEGSELIVGRTTARVAEYPEFELVLMLPRAPGLE